MNMEMIAWTYNRTYGIFNAIIDSNNACLSIPKIIKSCKNLMTSSSMPFNAKKLSKKAEY